MVSFLKILRSCFAYYNDLCNYLLRAELAQISVEIL
jgi:hypothetical protein